MENFDPNRRRIAVPLSRVVLMLILGVVFLVRAVASLFVKTMAMSSSILLIYFIAGAFLLALAATALALRSRTK